MWLANRSALVPSVSLKNVALIKQLVPAMRKQKIVAAGAAIAAFGALNGWILMQGQLPYAVARDKLFPSFFNRVSKKGTPVVALVISSVLVTLLMTMNYTKGLVEQFTFIILLSTLATLIPYIFSSMAGLILYFKDRNTLKMLIIH